MHLLSTSQVKVATFGHQPPPQIFSHLASGSRLKDSITRAKDSLELKFPMLDYPRLSVQTFVHGNLSGIHLYKEFVHIFPRGLRLPPVLVFPGPEETIIVSGIPKIHHRAQRMVLKNGVKNRRILPAGKNQFLVPCIASKFIRPAIPNFPKAMLLNQPPIFLGQFPNARTQNVFFEMD